MNMFKITTYSIGGLCPVIKYSIYYVVGQRWSTLTCKYVDSRVDRANQRLNYETSFQVGKLANIF